jgi:hypothetical protein
MHTTTIRVVCNKIIDCIIYLFSLLTLLSFLFAQKKPKSKSLDNMDGLKIVISKKI